MKHNKRNYPLHPLGGQVVCRPGDTSVDTSFTGVQDEADLSEPHQVKAIFGDIGTETQGPAGAQVPEHRPPHLSFERTPDVADTPFDYPEDTEAPEEAVGPHPRLGHTVGSFTVEEMRGDDEVEAAAVAGAIAHRSSTHAMLDAMEQVNRTPCFSMRLFDGLVQTSKDRFIVYF